MVQFGVGCPCPHATGLRRAAQLGARLYLTRLETIMIEVSAWNNGQQHASGAGYGLKLSADDRDRYFMRSWSTVLLTLPGVPNPIEVNVAKASFWSATCRELIHRNIGKWLIDCGYAPWERGRPPRFQLEPMGERRFSLRVK